VECIDKQQDTVMQYRGIPPQGRVETRKTGKPGEHAFGNNR